MRYHLQFRRYRLPFRAAVRTAHGVWAEREGLIQEGSADAIAVWVDEGRGRTLPPLDTGEPTVVLERNFASYYDLPATGTLEVGGTERPPRPQRRGPRIPPPRRGPTG